MSLEDVETNDTLSNIHFYTQIYLTIYFVLNTYEPLTCFAFDGMLFRNIMEKLLGSNINW